jgi:squalene-hopene/tetraprenyl-beta-curcumene cyclase
MELNSMRNFVIAFAVLTSCCFAQQEGNLPKWNPGAAAAYLDGRSTWWMAWPKAQRDHETFCVSCHTLAPYALGRPALRTALSETAPSANEKKMLSNIARRVRDWKEVEPFYSDQTSGLPKSSESRGTEAILNALVLASYDARSGAMSDDTRLALSNMWALQLRTGEMNGSWAWLQFHNAPWEGDSQFYGTALAAVAVGTAPGDYKSEPGIQDGIKRMNAWLLKNMAAQTPADRVVVLWASAKLPGLLTEAQQKTIVEETVAKQREDGGFSMSTLVGGWKRRDNTPLDSASDGYATGLVTYALRRVNRTESNAAVEKALAWLRSNQSAPDGRWRTASLNKQRELASDAGLFMSDAATAYAVMALEER